MEGVGCGEGEGGLMGGEGGLKQGNGLVEDGVLGVAALIVVQGLGGWALEGLGCYSKVKDWLRMIQACISDVGILHYI